jgi:endothelin-converting enzyme
VNKIVPEIDHIKLLAEQAPSAYLINENRKVIVGDINYFRNLSAVIKSTPRDTIHDYFQWRIISKWGGRMHKNFTAPTRRFSNSMGGRDPNVVSDRWRSCISEVDGGVSHIIGSIYIERAFSEKDKKLGDQIISDVRAVFAEGLKTIPWMSDKTKEIADKKGLIDEDIPFKA